jgi:LacI family transcriptional regulator, galactose operon repressor
VTGSQSLAQSILLVTRRAIDRVVVTRGASTRRATLADVARLAGVSPSTASRALNGLGQFTPETRAAVLAAAEELGFEPSPLARSLRTQRTHTIGFVVPDVSSPFYAAALRGAQRELEREGYRVMLMDSDQDEPRELEALRTLLTHQVDGLLVSTTGISPESFEATLSVRRTPCVFLDTALEGVGDGVVLLDNHAGIQALVRHLAGHGHRSIAVLAGPQRETSAIERLDAFRREAIALKLYSEEFVRVCRWTRESGRDQTRELLALSPPVSAIVACSAELALGCLEACREAKFEVPDAIALACFDDPYFAPLLEPALTAIAYEPVELGHVAASLLLERIRSDEGDRGEVRVPVRLVVRRSCGCDGAR